MYMYIYSPCILFPVSFTVKLNGNTTTYLSENWVEVAGKARPVEPLHEISVCLQSTVLMRLYTQ